MRTRGNYGCIGVHEGYFARLFPEKNVKRIEKWIYKNEDANCSETFFQVFQTELMYYHQLSFSCSWLKLKSAISLC
jgi:hypothetical protein